MAIKGQSFLAAALLIVAGAGFSGCVYDVGLGCARDGYYDDEYGCDPQGGYDAYYDCDNGHALSDIALSGGWFGNCYYPSHGMFLLNNVGRRYPMREQHHRYWGERRHNWYRAHRGPDWGARGYQERQRGYPDGNDYRREGRREDRRDGQRDGRIGSDDQWRGGNCRRTALTPVPNIDELQDAGRGREQDHGNAYGRPNRRGSDGYNLETVPSHRQQPPPPIQERVASAEQLPEPNPERQDQQAHRPRALEGGIERPN